MTVVVGTGAVGKGGVAVREHFLCHGLGAMMVVVQVKAVGKSGLAVSDHFLHWEQLQW